MRLLAMLVIAAAATGCTTVTETFPDHDAEQVWTTLVAVAQTPSYDDPDPAERWIVRRNDAWIDPSANRIEVYRLLRRTLHLPGTRPQNQAREWRFQIVFQPEPVPTATFSSWPTSGAPP